MNSKLLFASVAAALVAFPVAAQVAGVAAVKAGATSPGAGAMVGAAAGAQANLPAATPPIDSTAVNPPATSATTSATGVNSTSAVRAATGVATDTSASEADLTVGAPVTDSTGAPLGTISKVTRGNTAADAMVTLSAGGKTTNVQGSSLAISGGNLISTQTKASVWGQK